MNQINELVVLGVLFAVLVLKPTHVDAYIKSHLGRLLMIAALLYLTLRNYIYGVVALVLIVLTHETRVVEGNENMNSSNDKEDSDSDEADKDDSTNDDTGADDEDAAELGGNKV